MGGESKLEILMQNLENIYLERESELKRNHDRSLPFADALFDRWERARRLGFGEETSIYNSALVFGDVRIGKGTWVGPYALLDGSGGGLTIGSFCSISAGVHIYTHDTVAWSLTGGKASKVQDPVRIGDCCYIAPQSIVGAGVSIGDRCLVAANSFINRSLPDDSFAAGNPATIKGRVVIRGDNAELELFEKAE